MTSEQIQKKYRKWCKDTGRGGSFLTGKSIIELLEFWEFENQKDKAELLGTVLDETEDCPEETHQNVQMKYIELKQDIDGKI